MKGSWKDYRQIVTVLQLALNLQRRRVMGWANQKGERMLRSLEMLGQAKNALIHEHEILANNLANLGTVGFRKDAVAFHQILDEQSNAILVPVMHTDPSTGDFKQTGNPLDLAIQGEGYFSIQTARGTLYTRNGSFQLNDKGVLTDHNGNPVLSEKGTIVISPEIDGDIAIGLDGRVSVGENDFGKLFVANFKSSTQLKKVGQNIFEAIDGEVVQGTYHVLQGTLEMSTVNSVKEMVEMLDTLRLFEANQTTTRMQDEALGKAIRELA